MEIFNRFMKIKEVTTSPHSIRSKINEIEKIIEPQEIKFSDLKKFMRDNFGTLKHFFTLAMTHDNKDYVFKESTYIHFRHVISSGPCKNSLYKITEKYLKHLGFKIKGGSND